MDKQKKTKYSINKNKENKKNTTGSFEVNDQSNISGNISNM